MRSERFAAGCDPHGLAARLRSLIPAPGSVSEAVAEIIECVRLDGDGAVEDYTERFDTGGTHAPLLRLDTAALHEAERALAPAVRDGLRMAFRNIHQAALAGVKPQRTVIEEPGRQLILRSEPVVRAAVYVPGGRAPYPSTVMMGAATASAAGVAEIVVCSPPSRRGGVDPVVLGACSLAGVSEVYAMGGAQAIAALAFGTDLISAVDVIVGPGNLYVQEAKRQLSGHVGIDSFAGPSDLMVIAAGDEADPDPIALDLLAQAEHGTGSLVVGVSTSERLLDELGRRIDEVPATGAECALVHVASEHEALELAQAFAPEHLQLIGSQAEALAPMITRAGCLFVGPSSGTAFGDYIVGSNHILPTNGAARFASGLGTDHFRRSFTEVRIEDATELARAAAPIARAEGFEFHARSMEARIRENGNG
ncbi:MAG: histidinol dehydrogenase [Solirubrobacteraceae bacterium]